MFALLYAAEAFEPQQKQSTKKRKEITNENKTIIQNVTHFADGERPGRFDRHGSGGVTFLIKLATSVARGGAEP